MFHLVYHSLVGNVAMCTQAVGMFHLVYHSLVGNVV